MYVTSNNFIVFVSTNKIAKCIRVIFFYKPVNNHAYASHLVLRPKGKELSIELSEQGYSHIDIANRPFMFLFKREIGKRSESIASGNKKPFVCVASSFKIILEYETIVQIDVKLTPKALNVHFEYGLGKTGKWLILQ